MPNRPDCYAEKKIPQFLPFYLLLDMKGERHIVLKKNGPVPDDLPGYSTSKTFSDLLFQYQLIMQISLWRWVSHRLGYMGRARPRKQVSSAVSWPCRACTCPGRGAHVMPVSCLMLYAHAWAFPEHRLRCAAWGCFLVFLWGAETEPVTCLLSLTLFFAAGFVGIGYKWILAGVLGKSYISSDRVYSNVFLNYSWCFAHYTISFFRGQR